jgi:[ribosomal protein S5]-alanine N-acetyltransferase
MHNINFAPFPGLTTEHYYLREPEMSDENEIFAIRSDENVAKYLDRPIAKSIDEARQFIDKINNGINKNESIYWVITRKNENKFIGSICLWNISGEQSKAEIGFELFPDYQGKGIMQEVIPPVIEFGFNDMKLDLIEGEVDPENIKSIKLMEKFGFVYDKKLEDTIIYKLKNPHKDI